MRNSFYLIIIAGLGLGLTSQAYSFTYFQAHKGPNAMRSQGNFYTNNNPFSPGNFASPYSGVRNPYRGDSVYKSFNTYSTPVISHQGTYHGRISQYTTDPHAITNPYGEFGKKFNRQHITHPYAKHNSNNPYSSFQNPYNPRSIRHNGRYNQQYYDSNDDYLGHGLSNSYKTKSVHNPYHHSPYEPENTKHPYGKNKNFK